MVERDPHSSISFEARLVPQGSHASAPSIPLTRPVNLIGSRKEVVRLHLDSSTVSNVHCAIILNDWGAYIHDLASRTHTWVNGQKVNDVDLNDGDQIQIGRFQFRYEVVTRSVVVARSAPSIELEVSTLSDPLRMTKRVIQIGRRRGSDLEFEDNKVSNIHAIIFQRNGKYYIRDIGSRTGTWLNGKPIHQEPLADGSQIRIGSSIITVRVVSDSRTDDLIPIPIPVPPPSVIAPSIDPPSVPINKDHGPSERTSPGLPDLAPIPLEIEPETSSGEQPEGSEQIRPADASREVTAEAPAESRPVQEADANELGELRRNWQGNERSESFDNAAPEQLQTPITSESGPSEVILDQLSSGIQEEIETPDQPTRTSETTIEPIDLPPPPAPEPIIVPAADHTDHGQTSNPSNIATRSGSESSIDPDLPPETERVRDEVLPVSLQPLEPPHVDFDPEGIKLGQSGDFRARELSEEVPPFADEAEDEVSDQPSISGQSGGFEAPPDLEEASEATTPEPGSFEVGPVQVTPTASSDEIGEAMLEEPAQPVQNPPSSAPVSGESPDRDLFHAASIQSSSAPTPLSEDNPLEDLELIEESPLTDSSSFSAPDRASGLIGMEAQAPQPVPDLQEIDFSDLDAESDDSDTEFEDPSAETAFAVSEIDPFDLEENETAEPLMNLADSVSGQTHNQVEVIEETSPTPASVFEGFDELHAQEQTESSAQASHDHKDRLEIEPPSGGELKDLIPEHGPLIGGAFTPAPQGFVVGGSALPETTPLEQPEAELASESTQSVRPHRVGFGGVSAKPSSPFATGQNHTIADVLIGRRAAESVDVFANPSPTPEDLLLDEQAGPEISEPSISGRADISETLPESQVETEELRSTAERFRPRGAISAIPANQPIFIPSTGKGPEEDPVLQSHRRKRRLRTILLCTLAMLPLIGGIVLGVYQYVPVESKLVAAITYEGLSNASEHRRREFKTTHTYLLTDESTRIQALNELGPAWDNKKGFLASTETIKSALLPTPTERWPATNPDQMHLILMSRDKENDLIRLKALASALIKADEPQARRAQQLRDEAAAAQKELATLREELVRIDNKLRINQSLGENRPDDAQLVQIEAKRQAVDQEVTAAIKTRQELEAAIERLRTQEVSELAPLPIAEVEASDQTLQTLNAQVDQLRQQSEAISRELIARTEQARRTLDAAVSKLEADLTAARQQEVNGKFADYVDGAKRLASDVKNLTEDLLRRQEQQYTRLQELKQKLSDRFEQRTRQMLENDTQLQQMKAELSMLQRQQNAALAEGAHEEADRVSALMKLLQVKIEEKEYQHKNDPVQQEVISSLESIIQQTAKSIAEDRKNVNERLTASREEFLRKAPRVDELPEDQKEVAASIEKQFAAVTEARKAYSAAADEVEAQQARLEAENREKLARLQADIHSRKIELVELAREKQAIVAEQNRKKQLEQKQLELASARQNQENKEMLLASIIAEKQKMEEHRRKLLDTEQETAELIASKNEKEQRIRHLNVWLRSKEAELAGIIVPSDRVDVQSFDQQDRRPLYAGIGAGTVFLLMLIPIVHNLRLLSRETHASVPAREVPVSSVAGLDPAMRLEAEGIQETESSSPEPATTR